MSLGLFQFWKDVASQLRTSVPFVSEALNVLPLIDSKKIPYAATDNRSILVNTEGWDRIQGECAAKGEWYPTDQGAAATVLLHECLHVILKHKQRSVGKTRLKQWAKAVDIYTNNTIVDIFMLPPFNYRGEKMEQFKKALNASGTFDERFRGKDADQTYSILCDEEADQEDNQPPVPPPPGGDKGEKTDGDGAGGGGLQEQEDTEPEQPQGDKEGDADGDGGGGTAPVPEAPPKPLDGDIEDELDSGVPDDVSELIDNQMNDYLERNAHFAPSGSALAREIAEAKKKPPITMSEVLRKIRDVESGTTFDYRKPNRMDSWGTMFGYEGRMPSYHDDPSDKVRELIICPDWSGSMGEEERQAVFSLVRNAFKNVKRNIRLLGFTDHIVQDELITEHTVLTSDHTGGTNIACIVDHIEKMRYRPSAVVIITDGYDPQSMPKLERWRYKNRMRSIIINSRMEMPGLCFHVDCVDGFTRS